MEIVRLYPAYKDYIWGGTKLVQRYNKVTSARPVAESWELSFHNDGLTLLDNGSTLRDVAQKKDLGLNCQQFSDFPLLIKFIDAKQNLSVQVHPCDEYAIKNENSYGKSEAWYIVESDDDAGIYLGFNKNVSKAEFLQSIKNNDLTALLNFVKVKAGECYFIPSGTVHAIGQGCVILEVQQNSNVTYRVYDYGRKDKFGALRELHVDKAVEVSSLDKFKVSCTRDGILCSHKNFTVKKLAIKGETKLFANEKSFNCVTCVFGSGTIQNHKFSLGDSFFVPANYGEYLLSGNAEVLITTV